MVVLFYRSSKDVVDKKVDKGEVDFVQQVLDPVPEEGVHKVNKELQDPVQRPETADVNVNAAKMIDVKEPEALVRALRAEGRPAQRVRRQPAEGRDHGRQG